MSTRAQAPRLGSRADFPTLEAKAYLAHAAVAPTSNTVAAAIEESVRRQAAEGLAWIGWAKEQAELARQRFGELIGLDPLRSARQVARLANTSSGVVGVAACLRWEPGDRVVVIDGEFPTNVSPWLAAARTHGLVPVRVPLAEFSAGPERGLEALASALAGGARLVSVCAVQFHTGQRMPLPEIAELCRAHDALLFVDAIQAVGTEPIDAPGLGVDFLCAGAHKWLMGCLGAGFLYASQRGAAALEPRLVGWMSHQDPEAFLFPGGPAIDHDAGLLPAPLFLEQGVLNYHGLAAAAAGMGALLELGTAAIRAHVQALLDELEQGLVELGFQSLRRPEEAGRSAILALRPPAGRTLESLHGALFERGIVQTAPAGVLRLAPHWPNPHDEAEFVVEVVRELL